MSWIDQSLLFIASLLANFFSAFAGGGAGLIQFPVLIFLGLSFGIALATHKIASVALGLGATLRHLREGQLERQFAIFLLATGLPGVVIGAVFILQVPEYLARTCLGVLTIGLGIYSALNKNLGLAHEPRNRDRHGYITGGLVLFLIGISNGSITSGTGLFCTLWLVRLVWSRLSTGRGLHTGTGGRILEWGWCRDTYFFGEVKWTWLPALLAGSLIGGYLGAHV